MPTKLLLHKSCSITMVRIMYDLIFFGLVLTAFFLGTNYSNKLDGVLGATTSDELHSSSGSGFHLLSCPHIFDKQQTESNELLLTKQSAEKLISILSSSRTHASVLKTNRDGLGRGALYRSISEAVEKKIGQEATEVDISVPRKVNNKEACKALEKIIEEDKRERELQTDDEFEVRISILKLDNSQSGSILLRGARSLKKVLLKWKNIARSATSAAIEDVAYLV
mmetsp:Transcript_9362/g.14466  ORF Transcript_9362/g.14466 Transcript_9362/m.14466 type:complete len:224 (+) Transcript_9362:29-700(+)